MYFFGMKAFVVITISFLLISCSDTGSKNAQPVKPGVELKDTAPAVNKTAYPYTPVDVSPMDMCYFPDDYPILKMSGKVNTLPFARVIYSRPHRQGRKIFGGLLKYGEPWRLGANEATEIELFQPATIKNRRIDKGRYILYCIPQEKKWTIVFNSNLFTWGLKPDSSKDLFSFDIPINTTATPLEYFTMTFEKQLGGANLVMAWENVVGKLPLQF
jgi:hypothetical protein